MEIKLIKSVGQVFSKSVTSGINWGKEKLGANEIKLEIGVTGFVTFQLLGVLMTLYYLLFIAE